MEYTPHCTKAVDDILFVTLEVPVLPLRSISFRCIHIPSLVSSTTARWIPFPLGKCIRPAPTETHYGITHDGVKYNNLFHSRLYPHTSKVLLHHQAVRGRSSGSGVGGPRSGDRLEYTWTDQDLQQSQLAVHCTAPNLSVTR